MVWSVPCAVLGKQSYLDMLGLQKECWPAWPSWPKFWDASCNLGNSMHADKNDESDSHAVWVRTGDGSAGWYFCLPMHKVAIKLGHGVAIRWCGHKVPHCTCLPNVVEGDDFLSLFAAVPHDAMRQKKRLDAFSAVKSQSSRVVFERGDICLMKKSVGVAMPEGLSKSARRRFGKKNTVIQDVKVLSVSASEVCVKLLQERGFVCRLTPLEAQNRLIKK